LGVGGRRRSQRVDLRVPVRLHLPSGDVDTETLLVSRHGALLRHPTLVSVGTRMPVTNLASGETQTFRVAWVWPDEQTGGFKLGVEAVEGASDFWGPGYDRLVTETPRPAGSEDTPRG